MVASWADTGEPLSALVKDLRNGPGFGRDRAKLIAATEVTKAYAEGSIISYQRSGLIERRPYKVPVDDTHPGCRCYLSLEDDGDDNWVYVWNTVTDRRVCNICEPLHGTEQ